MDSITPNPPTIESKDIYNPWPHFILAMGFAAIIGVLIASYININIGENSIYPTNANLSRIDNLDRLKEHVVDAETGMRGFLLTRDPAFLEPYQTSVPRINADLAKIRQAYQSLPVKEQSLMDRLDRLVTQKLANIQSTLNASEAGDLDRVKQLIYDGKPVMDQIRNVQSDLRSHILQQHDKEMAQSIKGLSLMEGVTYVLGISSITLLIIWFVTTQRQQRLRKEFDKILLGKNQALEKKVQSRTEELVALAGYLSNARETEKANLARELHDELGALLTAAKHDAGWIERKLPADTSVDIRDRMARLQQSLSSVIALKRNLINNLRPAMLHDLGLLTALRNLADEFAAATEIKVKTELPTNEINIPEPVALALFRIVQEAFTNSRKYSRATEVVLELFENEETLTLNLYDNGVGFDLESPTIAQHGLSGMKHRVQMLKGKIEIVSAPGKGVFITVEVPMQAGQHQNRVISDRRQSRLPRI